MPSRLVTYYPRQGSKAHHKQSHQEDKNIGGLRTQITRSEMTTYDNFSELSPKNTSFFNFKLARAASTYHFYPRLSRLFPLVSLVPGGVGPQPKNTHYSRDHPLLVFVDFRARLSRLHCLQPDYSERIQIDNQQIKNKLFSKSQTKTRSLSSRKPPLKPKYETIN